MNPSRITSIKPQVKRPDRYSIYIDGKYVLSLHESSLLNLGLKKDQAITEAELQQLSRQSQIDKGYERALNLISHRLRSEWEVHDYLRRKDYGSDVRQAIVERLYERGYLDDLEFARRWVDGRRRLKATSQRRLALELRQKRLPDEVIDQALNQDEADDRAMLRQLIDHKRLRDKYQDEQKLQQYLVRQGFNYGDIKVVLSDED